MNFGAVKSYERLSKSTIISTPVLSKQVHFFDFTLYKIIEPNQNQENKTEGHNVEQDTQHTKPLFSHSSAYHLSSFLASLSTHKKETQENLQKVRIIG